MMRRSDTLWRLLLLSSVLLTATRSSNSQECPKDIGTNSTCKEIRDMGCYCIVEVEVRTASITISADQLNVTFQQQMNFDDASDYCARNNMQLVAIETREEQGLLGGFLADNLGGRGSKLQNEIPHDSDDNVLI
jgi:hypothetical protein